MIFPGCLTNLCLTRAVNPCRTQPDPISWAARLRRTSIRINKDAYLPFQRLGDTLLLAGRKRARTSALLARARHRAALTTDHDSSPRASGRRSARPARRATHESSSPPPPAPPAAMRPWLLLLALFAGLAASAASAGSAASAASSAADDEPQPGEEPQV